MTDLSGGRLRVTGASMTKSLKRLLTGDARIKRVRAALAERSASVEMRQVALRQANAPAAAQQAEAAAAQLLASAQEALSGDSDLNKAWTLALESDVVALEALTDVELQARAATLREEVRFQAGAN